MNDAESTREDRKEKGVHELLNDYYAEILVFGNQGLSFRLLSTFL
jgi:hypothetical protein